MIGNHFFGNCLNWDLWDKDDWILISKSSNPLGSIQAIAHFPPTLKFRGTQCVKLFSNEYDDVTTQYTHQTGIQSNLIRQIKQLKEMGARANKKLPDHLLNGQKRNKVSRKELQTKQRRNKEFLCAFASFA